MKSTALRTALLLACGVAAGAAMAGSPHAARISPGGARDARPAINPQPLPPERDRHPAINPQPLPPERDRHPAINPQPLPPRD